MVRPCFLLEGSSPVLGEFLLPAVEDRRLESHFIARLRDGLLLQQMPPQNGDLLFRRVLIPLLLHAFSPLDRYAKRNGNFVLVSGEAASTAGAILTPDS